MSRFPSCRKARAVIDSGDVRILISNDDGYGTPGIRALAAAMRGLGRVFVCAPEGPRSGVSSGLTINQPLRARRVERDAWAVSGNPADAVKLALLELLPVRPDVVVSGINNGLNTGSNVLYSGTVAAALEGAQHGITSFAISREFEEGDEYGGQARLAARLVRRLAEAGTGPAVVYNINVPKGRTRGVIATVTETAPYRDRYDRRRDPRGDHYYWLLGEPPRPTKHDGRATDEWAVSRGYISVTPLRRDLTEARLLGHLERRLSGG